MNKRSFCLGLFVCVAATACSVPATEDVSSAESAASESNRSGAPLPPDFCADGDLVYGHSYVASTDDDKECVIPRAHCLTKNVAACPAYGPLPPTYCRYGHVEITNVYLSSSDGKECELPQPHCVTNNLLACPLVSPLYPGVCDGEVRSEPHYVPSADGMECSLPSYHCVTRDPLACPML